MSKNGGNRLKISDSERLNIEEAIKRKIRAANRAAKMNNIRKVMSLYYDISGLFLDLGNEEKAKIFNKTAKKYEATLKIQEIIEKYINIAKNEYSKGNYQNVGQIYIKLSNIIKKIDPKRGIEFRNFGEKMLNLKPGQPISPQPKKSNQKEDIEQVLIDLVLVCPKCGRDLDPDSDICKYCGTKIE